MQNSKRKSSTRKRSAGAPAPLLGPRRPVDWWFIFKFNAGYSRGDPKSLGKKGIFDVPGTQKPKYDTGVGSGKRFSRHYVVASSANPTLKRSTGKHIAGATLNDPLGATFGQVYLAKKPPYYVLWNDQFHSHPIASKSGHWGHSKGMLAWNDDGEGFVLQVSTPSWPGAGNHAHPRANDGNTLGFVQDDDIEFSQHFFALRLTKGDLPVVLAALNNASVVTDPSNPQLVLNGGPKGIPEQVKNLGRLSKSNLCLDVKLSSGVRLISKASKLQVPPWQLVSAQLGATDLRVASWWKSPKIFSTTKSSPLPKCWDKKVLGAKKPGAVEIAISGTWPPNAKEPGDLGLEGGGGDTHNHAKLGVSTSKGSSYSIFGDMNQQGALAPGHSGSTCHSSQNGRGGMFYVVQNKKLHASVSALLNGNSAGTGRM